MLQHRRLRLVDPNSRIRQDRARYAAERKRLIEIAEEWTGKTYERPHQALPDIIAAHGYKLDYKPLPDGELGAIDPWEDTIWICSGLATKLRKSGSAAGVEQFTIAHELGHLRLHLEDVFDGVTGERHEKEADHFAGVFLVPAHQLRAHDLFDEMRTEWRSSQDLWWFVQEIAASFCVTGRALVVQLEELNVLAMDRKTRELSLVGVAA